MNRVLRASLMAALLSGAFVVGWLAVPGQTFACSCVGLDDASPFTGHEDAVLIGTVGETNGRGLYAFAVERWFVGGPDPVVWMASASQPMGDGTVAFSTCGLELATGQRWILAAARSDNGLSPGLCGPHASVDTPEGQTLIAAAFRTFGSGIATGSPPDPTADVGGLDLGLIAILLTLGIVAATFVAIVFVVGRRRSA